MISSGWAVARPSYRAFYTDVISEHTLMTAHKEMVLTKVMLNQRSDSSTTDFDQLSGENKYEYWSGNSDGRTIIFGHNQGGGYNHSDGNVKLRAIYIPETEIFIERGNQKHFLIRYPSHTRRESVYEHSFFKFVLKPGDKVKAKVSWPMIKTWQDRSTEKTELTSRQRDQLNKHVGYMNVIAQGIES